ncbi:MAG: hypothetical protein ABEK50_18635 [bacterium]
MKKKRLLTVILAATAVLCLYLLFPETKRNSPTDNQTNKTTDRIVTDGAPPTRWSFDTTETVNDSPPTRDKQRETSRSETDGLTIPGRVSFPGQASGETVTLDVTVLRIKTPLPDSIRNAIKSSGSGGELRGIIDTIFRNNNSAQLKDYLLGQTKKTIHTNTDGRFKLTNAPAGLYKIKSRDKRWKGHAESIVLETPDRIVPLRLNVRGNATFTGLVRTSSGRPIQGATIHLEGDTRVLRTNGKGNFTLSDIHPDRPLNFFSIHKPGFKPIEVDLPSLNPGEHRRRTFRLKKGNYLRVRYRTNAGTPVNKGAVLARRVYASGGSSPSESPPVVERLNNTGEAEFDNLQPGKYKFTLRSSPYLASPRVIAVDEHDSRTVSIPVSGGRAIELRYLDKTTGDTLTGIRPSVEVYTESGRLLKGGFELEGRTRNQTLRGYVHPRAHRLTIHSRPVNLKSYRPRTTHHTSVGNDTITIRLSPVPGQLEASTMKAYDLDIRDPNNPSQSVNWRDSSGGRYYIIDKKTGQKYQTGPLTASVARWPLQLPARPMLLYATIKLNETSYVMFTSLHSTSESQQYVKLIPRKPSIIHGTINRTPDNTTPSLVAGVDLIGITSSSNRVGSYIPTPLRSSVNPDGTYELRNVPAGHSLDVILGRGRTGNGHRTLNPGTPILHREPLETPRAGETRTLDVDLNLSGQ